MVPRRLKSTSYCEMGNSEPSQNAHPSGAKVPPNIRTSPTKGSAIGTPGLRSVLGRENASGTDAEVYHLRRLQVRVRLAAEVGQRKRRLAVSAVGRPEDREQSLILGDREELPVTKGPVFGGELERHDPDFADVSLGHGTLRLV